MPHHTDGSGLGEIREDDYPSLVAARSDLGTIAKALTKGWNVPTYTKQIAVQACHEILEMEAGEHSATKIRHLKLLAARVLVLMDTADIRRERNDIAARGQELDAQTGALRELLASPEGRRKLAGLTEPDSPQQLPAPAPTDPAPPIEHK